SPKTVSIPTIDDHVAEGPETFSVTMANVRNAAVATQTLVFLLRDNAPPAPFSCTVWQANRIDWKFPPVSGATEYDLSVSAVANFFATQITPAQATLDPTGSGDLVYSASVNILVTFGTATSFVGNVAAPILEDNAVTFSGPCQYTQLPPL